MKGNVGELVVKEAALVFLTAAQLSLMARITTEGWLKWNMCDWIWFLLFYDATFSVVVSWTLKLSVMKLMICERILTDFVYWLISEKYETPWGSYDALRDPWNFFKGKRTESEGHLMLSWPLEF